MTRPDDRRNGFALLAVLWGTALLALLAVALGGSARTEARLARNAVARAEAQALADGGVRLVMAEAATPGGLPRQDGTARTLTIAGAPVEVSVTAAGGLVDLNVAPPVLLAALFRAAGSEPERAARLAGAVADWRDRDDAAGPAGAEAAEYRDAGLPPPANRRFESLAELRRVLGVDDALYARAARLATIQSRQPGIDPRVAPEALLAALPGADRAAVHALVARRPLPPTTDVAGLGPPRELLSFGGTSALEVEARVALPEGAAASRRATLRLTGMPGDPVWLHAWDDGL